MGFEQEALDTLSVTLFDRRSVMSEKLSRSHQGESFVLRHLVREKSMTPSQLAAALQSSSGRISAVLGSLERKGLVTRRMDPDDRRTIRVSITDEGREREEREHEAMRSSICWIFTQMGERRTREFVDLAAEFSTYMSICRPGAPRPTPEQVDAAFERLARIRETASTAGHFGRDRRRSPTHHAAPRREM
ncbi:MAG: winged helix DNA-binding protein [Bifidobacterium sp.]|jgi:DNA-binding MarR family transcriptional regulator|nr:winged helix DNA-binding protein [Bifidobacterium sp.]MCI1864917.1 winged helix DNA-binding protein [Bifidobacterium sp.]